MSHNPNTHKWFDTAGLKVGSLNICNLLNKTSDVNTILSDNCFHVFGVSESRLSSKVSDDAVSIHGYSILRKDAQTRLETGLAIYIHQSLNYKYIDTFENHGVECLWIDVRFKGTKPILLGFLYRNPDERVEWFDRFEMLMEDVSTYSNEIILLGDFNIDLLKPQNKWIQICESFSLTQLVNTPTRKTSKSETLIDHIYVTNTINISQVVVPTYGLSDHYPICLVWWKKGIKVPRCSHKTISFRSYETFSSEAFLSDLSLTDFSNVYQLSDPDQALASWYSSFLPVFDKHVPRRTKRVKLTEKPKWLTSEIFNEIKIRDKLLKSKGRGEEFRKQRNKITSMKRAAKKKYFSELISNKKDTKSIWRAINQLSGKSNASSTSSAHLSAEILNHHFTNIAEKIIESDNTDANDLQYLKEYCLSKSIRSQHKFAYIGINEVYKELNVSKSSKSRGTDDLDSKILKLSAPFISDTLTYIYNLCIEKSYYPQAFKDAKVLPLFKTGDQKDPSNYRPISLLSNLSKPLEKHLQRNLQSHFMTYNLFHPNQSGFMKNHSCHTALTNLVEQWHANINNNLLTGVIFVDFTKAFDVIDHNLLRRKLVLYGLSSESVDLLYSFISNRRQVVFQSPETSSLMSTKYGVPQGSVLGPVLFSVYINDLPLHISSPIELFADDTTLHTQGKTVNALCSDLQTEIDKLINWTELNHMSLHPKKSKFMLVTTRQKRQNLTEKIDLKINNKILEEVDTHKILGLNIDKNLSWASHISSVTKKLSKKVFQLNRIKHFLDQHTRKLFFHSYIQPDIDFASTCWDLASKVSLKPLESLFRRSIKLVLHKSSLQNSDYKALKILPFQKKCYLNKATFMYKIMTCIAPPYLSKRFKLIHSRFKDVVFIPRPRTDLFMTSLTFSGAKLWNDMPRFLKNKSTLFSFKIALKRYLFDEL